MSRYIIQFMRNKLTLAGLKTEVKLNCSSFYSNYVPENVLEENDKFLVEQGCREILD